ncbi:MAG: TonB-dependent receptor, partial [Bacteroidota bacterium]
MFRQVFIFLFLVAPITLLGGEAGGSRGVITGRVVLDNGQPAVGATVALKNTQIGVATREDGTFRITGVLPGPYELVARLVGYEQSNPIAIRVSANETVEVAVRLIQDAVEIDQIVITGTRRRSAEDVRSSVTSMTPEESKILPGAAEDVMRSLQALPGVTSVNDFSSQLVVRGSGPDQNLIMIDGFEVINPYRLYGFVSMFNPETLSGISLQTGGYNAEYGDRLSSVLDVRNREGRGEDWVSGKLNMSLTNMNLVFEGGIPVNGASYLISLRRTYYDLILGPVLKSAKLVEGDVALPNFQDLQAKMSFPVNSTNKILLNAVTSRDGVNLISGVERDRPDSVNVFDESYNTLLGATWVFNPARDLIAQTQLSWYRNDGTGTFDGTFVDPAQQTGDIGRGDTLGLRYFQFGVDYRYVYTKTSFSQKLLWDAGGHDLEFGYGIDFLQTDYIRFFEIDEAFQDFLQSLGQAVPTSAVETVGYNRMNLFVQDKIYLGDRLFIQPGLRVDLYPALKRQIHFSPRLNVSFKIDELSTLRGAFGVYFQSPGMEKQDFRNRVIYTEDFLKDVVAERANHLILGYDRMLTPAWQFKAETYYKGFTDVIVPEKLEGSRWVSDVAGDDPFDPSSWSTPVQVSADSFTNKPVNDAIGSSYGFEVMIQKIRSLPSDRFTGWVSYALSYAERERDEILSPFLFDQRHAMNIVGNYRFAPAWDVGVRFTLRSGRPQR